MSKVFSAKRQEVHAEYQFIDDTTVPITIVSLSTNEGKKINNLSEDGATGNDIFEMIARLHLQRNEASMIDAIIAEQMNEGNIIEFAQALNGLIESEKQGKSQD